MEEIFSPNRIVAHILGKQPLSDEPFWHWSVYIFPVEDGHAVYFYSTLTKQCVSLPFADGKALWEQKRFSRADILQCPDLVYLAENRMLVPEDKDETKLYEGLVRILRLRTTHRQFSSYTIMTTSACNARCFYCVEEGWHAQTMSEDTVEQTIAFILRTRDPSRRTHLSWFGGEPLLASHVIERISAALTQQQIDFDASMVSNGILIQDDLLQKMLGPWRVRRIQITLDGDEKEYHARKQYLAPYPSAYQTILGIIRKLSETPIQTILRCNVDHNNVDTLGTLIDDLAAAVPNKKHVYPYFTPLFAERSSQGHAELFRRCMEAKELARQRGFSYAPHSPLHKMRYSLCRAENPFGCTMIAPDGLLYNCDFFQPGTASGNVREGITRPDYLQSFALPEPAAARCRDCTFLPHCTTFSRCPYKLAQCKEARAEELLFDLRAELRQGRQNGDADSSDFEEQLC